MTQSRSREIFLAALKFPAPEHRADYVEEACAGDRELLLEVHQLLESHARLEGHYFSYAGAAEGDSVPTPPAPDLRAASTIPAFAAEPGGRLGAYRLLEKIGEGGMGEVWVADQVEPIRRRVAIKIIKLGMDTEQVLARFEGERQALALMDHPNIAHIHEAGATEAGRPYFAMELVQGLPIVTHCDRHRLSVRQRLDLFLQVCEGVQHAHQKAIIHRDLKPSNVLVTVIDGKATPKIIDFGVAKATAQRLTERTVYTELGQLVGTPEYMSPEQAEMDGQNVDTRTDVYSLGAILYELLVGVRILDGRKLREGGYEELRRRIREEEPSTPSTRVGEMGKRAGESAASRFTDPSTLRRQLRGDLDWITMKALEKDRTRRYGSPAELAADIRRHLANRVVTAGPPSATYRLRKFVRRHSVGVGVAAALLIMLVAFSVTMTVQARQIARERDRANREAVVANQVTDFLVGMFEQSSPNEARGKTITVREVLDEGARRIESELADQPTVRARMMSTIGEVYGALGLYDSAEPLLQSAVQIDSEFQGKDSPQTARALHLLGEFYSVTGDYDRADSLYHEALRIRRESGHPGAEVAESLNRIAELRRFQGSYAQAESLYLRALAIRKSELGEENAGVAETLNDLSVLYWYEGRLVDAESAMRKSLAIREHVLPASHPALGANLNNLGAISYQRGQYADADSLYRRALELRETSLGAGHPDVAQTLHNMGALYVKEKRFADAEAAFRRAAEIFRHAFGPGHPLVAHSLNSLGTTYLEEGELDEALPVLQEALRLREEGLGPEHVNVGITLYTLADLHQRAGRSEEANSCVRRALPILEKGLGTQHRHFRAALEIQATLLEEQGHKAEADSLRARYPAESPAG